jgi:hypothetical protein
MTALSWFMDHHTSFSQTLKDLCLKLAHFVLTNNCVECKELSGAMYQQVVGTAMRTSFSVVYAIIFMIWLETPIVSDERFRSCIQLYKRFIDDFLSFGRALLRHCASSERPWEKLILTSAWTGLGTTRRKLPPTPR